MFLFKVMLKYVLPAKIETCDQIGNVYKNTHGSPVMGDSTGGKKPSCEGSKRRAEPGTGEGPGRAALTPNRRHAARGCRRLARQCLGSNVVGDTARTPQDPWENGDREGP